MYLTFRTKQNTHLSNLLIPNECALSPARPILFFSDAQQWQHRQLDWRQIVVILFGLPVVSFNKIHRYIFKQGKNLRCCRVYRRAIFGIDWQWIYLLPFHFTSNLPFNHRLKNQCKEVYKHHRFHPLDFFKQQRRRIQVTFKLRKSFFQTWLILSFCSKLTKTA